MPIDYTKMKPLSDAERTFATALDGATGVNAPPPDESPPESPAAPRAGQFTPKAPRPLGEWTTELEEHVRKFSHAELEAEARTSMLARALRKAHEGGASWEQLTELVNGYGLARTRAALQQLAKRKG